MVVPMVFALFAYPVMKDRLNYEEIGVVALVLVVVNIAPLLDFGISKVITKKIASSQIYSRKYMMYAWTGITTCLFASISLSIILYISGFTLIENGFVAAKYKILLDFSVFCIPAMVVVTSVKGVFEGSGRFDLQNKIKSIFLSLMFLMPTIVILAGYNYEVIIKGQNLVGLAWMFISVAIATNGYKYGKISTRLMIKYVKKGGWIFISNVTTPVIQYFDRVVIGYVLGIAAVGVYSPVADIFNRSISLSVALSSIFYSAVCYKYVNANAKFLNSEGDGNLNKLFRFVNLAYIGLFVTIWQFEKKIIVFWMGDEYYELVQGIVPFIMIGVYFNSIAQFYYSYLQATENAKKVAQLHVCEAGFYIVILYFSVKSYGLISVAAVGALRSILDYFLLKSMVPAKCKNENSLLFDNEWYLCYLILMVYVSLIFKCVV